MKYRLNEPAGLLAVVIFLKSSEADSRVACKLCATVLTVFMLGAMFVVISWPSAADQSSADASGYYWTDSKSPSPSVSFNWIEISGTGTNSWITGDDNYGSISIGFVFPFYGNSYNQVYASTNGLLTFGSGSSEEYNDYIPDTSVPNNFITPYWDDLCVDYSVYNNGAIYYQTIGTAPNRQLVVEWWEISERFDYDLMTFEVILNETGEIWFQYLTMSGMTGVYAVVGLENFDGTDGCPYSNGAAVLEDNLAVRFERGPIGFGWDQTSRGNLGSSLWYDLRITNSQSFTDSFDLSAVSSQGWTVEFYDATGSVLLSDTNGDLGGLPDTGDLTTGASFDLLARVTIPLLAAGPTDYENLTATSFANSAVSDTVTLTTIVNPARFSSPHSDYVEDTDSDGSSNWLVVAASINVSFAGTFTLQSTLYDSAWDWVESDTNTTYLDAGIQTIDVRFDGRAIYAHGVDGPFYAYLWLYDSAWYYLGLNTHTTAAYTWSSFEEVTTLAPPHSDYGLDTDSDTYYNYLVVQATLDVKTAGDYEVQGWMYDASWNYLGWATNVTYLDVGIRSVELLFDGAAIFGNGEDGPYTVYLELYDGLGAFIDEDTYYTSAYLPHQFDGTGALLAPPHSDYGYDIDGNSLYNYLVVEVCVFVASAGDYYIWADLENSWGWSIATLDNYTYLDVGYQNVTLAFQGYEVYQDGVNGPYYVDIELYDGLYNYLDFDTHTTAAYLYTDFDGPSFFDPPHSDYGLDTDSDTLYDYLVITARISVTAAGNYNVGAYVYDGTGSIYLGDFWNATYLDLGIQLVDILVDGMIFYDTATDGPYTVYLELYDSSWDWLDENVYTTGAYLYSDFDPPPALFTTSHTDYGRDTDSDSYYNRLVIGADVSVDVAADYNFQASLYSPTGVYLGWTWNYTYLGAGSRTVDLAFLGSTIYANGENGQFTVYLSLYDASWNLLDTDTYQTASYLYADFDPGAVFDPPHDDHGFDTDNNTYYNYLAVEVTVSVEVADAYTVQGKLYDSRSSLVFTVEVAMYLTQGTHVVELRFMGVWLNANRVNGPFDVELDLYDGVDRLLDEDVHVTAAYLWNEFEDAPPAIVPPWLDDFEQGSLGGSLGVNWTASDPVLAGVDSSTSNSGSFSMWTCGDYVEVVSWFIDTSGSPWVEVNVWIQRGDDTFSEDPDPGEDLVFEYKNATGDWIVLETFLGSGTAGQIYTRTYNLSADAMHPTFQLRFTQLGGSGVGNDYWHIDDVRVNAVHVNTPPTAAFTVTPSAGNASTIFEVNAGTSYDSEDSVGMLQVRWDWEDDGIWDTSWTNAKNATHQYAATGMYTIRLEVVDSGGLNDTITITVSVDNTAPVTTFAIAGTLQSGWYLSSVTVWLNASDDLSGVAQVMYRMGMGLWQTYSAPLTISADGAYALSYYAVDNAGNEEAVQIESFSIDAQAPTTTAVLDGIGGANGWFTTAVDVTLNAVDNGMGVDDTRYRVVGESDWTVYTGEFTVSGEGIHTVEFYSEDLANHRESTKSVELMIDSVTPTLEVDLDDGDSVAPEDAEIPWTASDATSGIDRIEVSLDGGAVHVLGSTATSISWTNLSLGDHYIVVRAIDEAGLVTEVRVDFVVEEPSGGISSTALLIVGLIGAIVAAIAVVGVLLVMKRRRFKEPQPPMMQGPPPPPQGPQV